MKKLISSIFCCCILKFGCSIGADINKAAGQSPYILPGGSHATFGDQPATVDSVHHLGTPLSFMEGFRVYCFENSTNYIVKLGVWVPVVYISPGDTAAMLAPYYKTAIATAALATKQDFLVSGTNIKTVGGVSVLGTGDVPVSTGTVTSVGITSSDFSISGSPITSSGNITANLNTSGVTAGTYPYLTVNNKGISTAGINYTFNNAPARSIVTTAAAANGWRISTDRVAIVSYSVTIGTTVSLSGNSSGYVVLEIAPTNSAIASDWSEISRITCGQSGTLIIGLTLDQLGGGILHGIVPIGYYVRQRSVNVAGTPVFTPTGQQEVY